MTTTNAPTSRFIEPLDVLFLRGNQLFGEPGSYGEALCIIGEYVNITDTEQERKPSLRQQLKETKTAEPSARPKPEKQQER